MKVKIILVLGFLATSLLSCAEQKVSQAPNTWEQQNKIAIEAFKHAKPNPCFMKNEGVECYQQLAEQDKGK